MARRPAPGIRVGLRIRFGTYPIGGLSLNSKKVREWIDDYIASTATVDGVFESPSGMGLNEGIKSAAEELINAAVYNPEFALRSHRPFIGKFILLGKNMVRKFLRWYINPIVWHQNDMNRKLIEYTRASTLQISRSVDVRLEALEKGMSHLTEVSLDISKTRGDSLQVERRHQEFRNALEALENEVQCLKLNLDRLCEEGSARNQREQEILQGIKALEASALRQRHAMRLTKAQGQTRLGGGPQESVYDEANLPFDYYMFEEKYRGHWEVIRERQKHFLRFFEGDSEVLDIGCGRGEFLSLLNERGIKGVGVDLDEDMLSVAKQKGLVVCKADGTEYLGGLEECCLDGIFMSHVIEHIPTERVVTLFSRCFAALRYNGTIVVETPNPLSLSIFSRSFYQDPTHVRPVHPETLKFVLRQVGFDIVEEVFSGHIPLTEKLIVPKDEVTGEFAWIRDNFTRLNEWLYGPQDYAIVARKS